MDALLHSRFSLLAAKATHKLELQAVERKASKISENVEDVVDLLLSEAEELGALHLTSPRDPLRKEDLSVFTYPARLILDKLNSTHRKVDVFKQLAVILIQSYHDFKQQCEEMTVKIETLTEDFDRMGVEEVKECRNCKRCLSQLSDFRAEVEQLHSELAKTEARLIDTHHAKEQLSQELGTYRNKEQINSSFSVPEVLELQEELKRAEITIAQLEKQAKVARQSMEYAGNVEKQVEIRELKLRQAQDIIKKLNSENERLVQDCFASEELAETLKRESHQYEKSAREALIQLQSLDIMHKTEIRLREEIQHLKNEVENLKEESVNEENRAKEYIGKIMKENEELQSQIVELETSILELDKEGKQFEDTVKLHLERINDLEQALASKTNEISSLTQEIESREDEHQAEISHIKRIAENTIRGLQLEQGEETARSARSPIRSVSPTLTPNKRMTATAKKPVLNQAVNPGVSREFSDMQLMEAIQRELILQKGIQEIVKKSSAFLTEKMRNLKNLEAAIRPETERWMMRNEELETIISDFAIRLNQLLKLNRDLQKVIQIKEKQLIDHSKISQQTQLLTEELNKTLRMELENTHNLVTKDVIGKGREIIGQNVNIMVKNTGEMKGKCEEMEENNRELKEEIEKLVEELRESEDKLNRRNSDLAHIRALLGGLKYAYLSENTVEEPDFSPSEDIENILKDINSLSKDVELKDQDLVRVEEKLRELITSNKELQEAFEEDKDSLLEEIREISKAHSELQAELNRVSDQNMSQKQTWMEETRRISGVLEETRSQLAGITQERDRLDREKMQAEQRVKELAGEMDKMQGEIHVQSTAKERLLQEVEDLQATLSRSMKSVEPLTCTESLLTEVPLVRRDLNLHSTRSRSQDPLSLEKLLSQKEEYIKELEQKLEINSHSALFDDTQIGDPDMKRTKNKLMAYKRSFNKRLEEFEAVLRLIEDAVTALEHGHALQIEKIPATNPTLDAWLDTLLKKISDAAEGHAKDREREMRTYHTLLTTISGCAEAGEEDRTAAVSLSNELVTQNAPDLHFLASQLTILVKRVMTTSDPRKSRDYSREDVVCLSSFHARLLLSAISSLDSVELSLIDRKESILQVSEELEGLTQSLSEISIRSSDLPNKIAEMFSRFSLQFLQDLKRDLQAFAEALRDLKDVSRSNPGSGRGTSLWSFAQTAGRRT